MSPRRQDETDCVRELARQVAAIAGGPENEQIKQRWRDVNALRQPDRAPVWCRPVGAWAELLPEEALSCTDPWLRSIERRFRRILIKHDIHDDSPVDEWFPVDAVFDVDPPNRWGFGVSRTRPEDEGGAWAYDPPLQSEADFAKLRLPTYTYNRAKTATALNRADELLGDILPVRRTCGAPLSATLCNPAADLRGLTQTMVDMIDRPDLTRHLMGHLLRGTLQAMDQVEAAGLLTPNNHGPMICSDPVGPEPEDGTYSYKNLWCMANSQEFDQVSPEMWEEFCLTYQVPILLRFGLSAYGCCEDLTRKMNSVLAIPNLRIFVCSAWTDLDRTIGRCGRTHVIMWRQKASDVVFPAGPARIRADLEEGIKRLEGCHYQIVLRELQTLAGHPDRLHVWTRLAKELAAKYA